METTIHVFVYGSLRKGCASDMKKKYPHIGYKGSLTIRGTLYELEGLPYPGVLLNNKEHIVSGEVYEIDETVLHYLDEYEGYNPHHREDSVYFRNEMTIFLNGVAEKCFLYEVNTNKCRLARIIESGDWKRFVEQNPLVTKRRANWPDNLKAAL